MMTSPLFLDFFQEDVADSIADELESLDELVGLPVVDFLWRCARCELATPEVDGSSDE